MINLNARDVLEDLDFREEEIETYLALLQTGASPAGELAKFMNTPRPTIYGYLEGLVRGGLVNKSLRHGVKIFVPEPGDKIRFLYQKKIDDFKSKEKALDHIIPELGKLAGAHLSRPRMQFFEGPEGIEAALADALFYPGTTMLTFWPIKSILSVIPEEFFRYFNKQRIRAGIHVKAIWPPDQSVDMRRYPYMSSDVALKREVRIAPAHMKPVMGYRIYANKVMFASSKAESFCFILESAELVQIMTLLHLAVWDVSQPLPKVAGDIQHFLKELEEKD